MKLFITNAGLAAERHALSSGANIKIASVVVDSIYYPDESDPELLEDVQLNPNDQTGASAIYPVFIKSDDKQLSIAWTLPASSGGYDINGIGFKLEDGTLWGYQRVKLGFKPIPDDNTYFEPHGVATHATSNSELFSCELSFDGLHATLNDVDNGDRNVLNIVKAMMRKVEGKLGRVRLYAANDVDDDYLPLSGQTIKIQDYPDYFKHLGVTATTLKLPDWGAYGYVRQFSSTLEAGLQLEQQLQQHKHNIRIADGGAHTPMAQQFNLGSKTGYFELNKRFQTHSTGSHTHDVTVAASGYHVPKALPYAFGSKGAQIVLNGRFSSGASGHHSHSVSVGYAGSHRHNYSDDNVGVSTALDHSYGIKYLRDSGEHNYGRDGGGFRGFYQTSETGSHAHDGYCSESGSHSHYTDVNFGTKTISTNIGTHTISMEAVQAHGHNVTVGSGGAHTHNVDVNFGRVGVSVPLGDITIKLDDIDGHAHTATCENIGFSENRPNTTVAVYAVKVKYVVDVNL